MSFAAANRHADVVALLKKWEQDHDHAKRK